MVKMQFTSLFLFKYYTEKLRKHLKNKFVLSKEGEEISKSIGKYI